MCASECTIKRSQQGPVQNRFNIINTRCKICVQDFFKFGPDGKNLCKVKFMEVRYYIIRGVTVLCGYDV